MKLLLNTFLILTFLVASQVESSAQRAKYQSVFIYNFMKYVKWPDAYSGDELIVAVIGDQEIMDHLQDMAATKGEVSGKKIVIQKFNSIAEISKCHILFLSEEQCQQIDQVNQSIANMPVLLLADKAGMAKKGAVISFVEKGGSIKFELNMQEAQQRGLMVAGTLAGLAILV